MLSAQDVHAATPDAVAARIRDVVGDAPAYLSFDIDALDPAFAPGTGTPEIGGLASGRHRRSCAACGGLGFVGMDVVEVAPAYDVAEITALAAATMVWEYLALVGSAGHALIGLAALQKRITRAAAMIPICAPPASLPGRGAAGLDASHVPRAPRRNLGAQQRRNASFSVGPANRGPGSLGSRLCWLIGLPRCEVLAASAESRRRGAIARDDGCLPRFVLISPGAPSARPDVLARIAG